MSIYHGQTASWLILMALIRFFLGVLYFKTGLKQLVLYRILYI